MSMKNFIIPLLLIGFCSTHLSSQSEFITIWETLNANETISLEATSKYVYLYDIDWGDGSSNTDVNRTITHTYTSPGIYQVIIKGTFPHFSATDVSRLISIDQWGTQVWRSMKDAFRNATSMTYNAADKPNLTAVTDLSYMFSNCQIFNGDIGDWDISNIQNVSSMFENALLFDQNLGGWDIGNVTSIGDMLSLTSISVGNYDRTLIGWSQLNNIPANLLFRTIGAEYCASEAERQQLIDLYNWSITFDSKDCSFITTWNTENFGGTDNNSIEIPTDPNLVYNYNVDWDNDGIYEQMGITGSVTHTYSSPGIYTVRIQGEFPTILFNTGDDRQKIINIDQWGENNWSTMWNSFSGCSNMNSDALDSPNLSQVEDLTGMFLFCDEFNSDIGSWNTSNITSMNTMFGNCVNFNQDIGNWDVSNVSDMIAMFLGAKSFNADISNWNVSNVNQVRNMFNGAENFNQDIGSWNTSAVYVMDGMFEGAINFNQDISEWNTSNVSGMSSMFEGATKFDRDLGNWDISNVDDMESMFDRSGISRFNYDFILYGWSQQNLKPEVSLGAANISYCAGEESRQQLIDNYKWTIAGDIYDCPSSCPSMQFKTASTSLGNWEASSSWGHNSIPGQCDIVIIPQGSAIGVLRNTIGACHTIRVDHGGEIILENEARLDVVLD